MCYYDFFSVEAFATNVCSLFLALHVHHLHVHTSPTEINASTRSKNSRKKNIKSWAFCDDTTPHNSYYTINKMLFHRNSKWKNKQNKQKLRWWRKLWRCIGLSEIKLYNFALFFSFIGVFGCHCVNLEFFEVTNSEYMERLLSFSSHFFHNWFSMRTVRYRACGPGFCLHIWCHLIWRWPSSAYVMCMPIQFGCVGQYSACLCCETQ